LHVPVVNVLVEAFNEGFYWLMFVIRANWICLVHIPKLNGAGFSHSRAFMVFLHSSVYALPVNIPRFSPSATMDKENEGKIRRLEAEKAHYEEQLRRRTEEVEMLKREKARLEKSVRDKEAIAKAQRQ